MLLTACGNRRESRCPSCAATYRADAYQALVFVGVYGGLHIGELAGLRRRRVDLDARTVDVAETVVEVEGRVLFGPPKTRPDGVGSASLAGWSTSWRCTCERRAARPTRCSAHQPAGRCA